MLHSLVAVVPGPSLPARVVGARPNATVAAFETCAALVDRAGSDAVACVIADAAALDADDLQALRGACPDATLCAVAAEHVAGADAVLRPDDQLAGRVAALVRFALGEPMRCGVRRVARGSVWVDGRRPLPILDVGEGGVRVGARPRDIVGDAALHLELEGGPTIAARGREIRREEECIVLGFNALVARDRTTLRRWLLGRAHLLP
jgi:hypothetical protein